MASEVGSLVTTRRRFVRHPVLASLVVKRTAKLVERLLPHLSHSQALEWSSQLHNFRDWHEAQSSSDCILPPVTALERDDSEEDALIDHRFEVACRMLGTSADSYDDDDRDPTWLLMFLGMSSVPCLGSLPRLASLGDGGVAWRALQFDRWHEFAKPQDPRYCWASVPVGGPPEAHFFPAGSITWNQSDILEALAKATRRTNGFQLPAAEVERWATEHIDSIGRSSIAVDVSAERVVQSRRVPMLLVSVEQLLKAAVVIDCSLTASRWSGGVHCEFRVVDSIGSSKIEHDVGNCLYNAGIEEVPEMLDLLRLLQVSDSTCTVSSDFSSTGSSLNAMYADALRQGFVNGL